MHDLEGIKTAFRSIDKLRMTCSARKKMATYGLQLEDMVNIIQALTSQSFYKSMTTYTANRLWQDAYYHAHFKQLELYIKSMVSADGHLIVSLSEEEE